MRNGCGSRPSAASGKLRIARGSRGQALSPVNSRLLVGSRLRDLPLDALNKLEGEKPPGFTRNYEPSSDPELLVSIVW